MKFDAKSQATCCAKEKAMGWGKALVNRSHASSRRWALRQKKAR